MASKNERVLLKRTFATPFGRFAKSVGGEPTLIPKRVLELIPLPRDAIIVGDDYEPAQAARTDTQEMSEHDIEAEVNRRINAKMAADEARKRGEAMAKVAERADAAVAAAEPAKAEDEGFASILGQPVRKIGPMLEDLDGEQLVMLGQLEEEDANRRGVHALIAAALEDLAEDQDEEAVEDEEEEAVEE